MCHGPLTAISVRSGWRLAWSIGVGRGGQVVLHAQQLEVADAGIDVEARVRQVALGVGRLGGQLRLHQEVVRHGGGGLEVEALLRADAAVGEVRQHHQRHRRAVAAEAIAVVLPERPAAAVLARPRRCRPWSGSGACTPSSRPRCTPPWSRARRSPRGCASLASRPE